MKDGWLFVTGQLATDPGDDSQLPDGIEAQTEKVMDNLRRVLRASNTCCACAHSW